MQAKMCNSQTGPLKEIRRLNHDVINLHGVGELSIAHPELTSLIDYPHLSPCSIQQPSDGFDAWGIHFHVWKAVLYNQAGSVYLRFIKYTL